MPEQELVDDAARYAWMHQTHQKICGPRPFLKKEIVARTVGRLAFGISTERLCATNITEPDVTTRQKIMAFAHIETGESFNRIGRMFLLDHSSAQHSVDKYGAAVIAAVHGGGEFE
jgi:hypothetical protein